MTQVINLRGKEPFGAFGNNTSECPSEEKQNYDQASFNSASLNKIMKHVLSTAWLENSSLGIIF